MHINLRHLPEFVLKSSLQKCKVMLEDRDLEVQNLRGTIAMIESELKRREMQKK